jgi:hypothetical protein
LSFKYCHYSLLNTFIVKGIQDGKNPRALTDMNEQETESPERQVLDPQAARSRTLPEPNWSEATVSQFLSTGAQCHLPACAGGAQTLTIRTAYRKSVPK